ncbi:MAG: type II toxin-antitoxin system RelE/ParE family toxin [Firmicutes bacterium]|nr:type II toxin-antitoxin system RelE/ParE family toxin [Bacillota bacterium]
MNSREPSKFNIILDKQAAKYLERLETRWQRKIINILENMASNPFGGDIETIKGKPGYYRRRVGRYRLKFTILIEKREIRILEFGPKGDFDY